MDTKIMTARPSPDAEQSRISQNKYHAMIDDIARCCRFMGRRWRASSWKRLLVEAYANVERDEAEARGDPDPFPDKTMLVVGLDGGSIVHLGEQTRHFTRAQSAAFVESLYAYGSEQGVIWSEKSAKFIKELGMNHGTNASNRSSPDARRRSYGGAA